MRQRSHIHRSSTLFAAWVAALLVFGWLILGSQRDGRADFDSRFHNRVEMAVGQLQTFRGQILERQRTLARHWLSGDVVTDEQFKSAVAAAGHSAALLLDRRGAVLHVAPRKRELLGTTVASDYPHLTAAVAGRSAVSPVVLSAARQEHIIAFAIPFDTPGGRRVFSSAIAWPTPLWPATSASPSAWIAAGSS